MDVGDLIGGIYEAALERDPISTIIGIISVATESESAVFCEHKSSCLQEHYHNVDTALLPVLRKYAGQNPLLQQHHRMPVGQVVLPNDFLFPDSLKDLELYHEGWRPAGWRHTIGVCAARSQQTTSFIGIFRPENRPDYGAAEVRLLSAAAPHIRRALDMRNRAEGLRFARSTLEGALDRLAMAVVLVDRTGHIHHCNTEAAALLTRCSHLAVRGGYLTAHASEDHSRLKRLLSRLSGAEGDPSGTAIVIGECSTAPIWLLSTPLAVGGGGVGVVVMGSMARRACISRDVLQGLFGLTAAEADLAARIARLERLSTIAGERGRSTHTVRAQLKAVMAKTGTGRQAELVQLLAWLAQLRDES